MPPPRTPRRLRPRLRAVAAASSLALVVLSAGCSSTQRQPTDYGKDYKANFMLGCTGLEDDGEAPPGGEALAPESYCTCVYEGLKEKVPFDEAREFEQQQSEADSGEEIDVPKNIQSVFDDCEPSR